MVKYTGTGISCFIALTFLTAGSPSTCSFNEASETYWACQIPCGQELKGSGAPHRVWRVWSNATPCKASRGRSLNGLGLRLRYNFGLTCRSDRLCRGYHEPESESKKTSAQNPIQARSRWTWRKLFSPSHYV